MKQMLRALGYLAVLIIGFAGGTIFAYVRSYSALWGQVGENNAEELMFHLVTLSKLRLGRIDEAIKYIEVPIDGQVLMIANGQNAGLHPNPEKMTATSLRALQMAKAYRALYPSTTDTSNPPAAEILAPIPNIELGKCDSTFCQLIKAGAKRANTDGKK